MIVKMKEYEKQAIDYSHQFKSWELQCVAKDTYLAAYRRALQDALLYGDGQVNYNHLVGQAPVEVEFKNGDHQLTDDIKSARE